MCSNYVPVIDAEELLAYFGVQRDFAGQAAEAWPTDLAPFIRLADGRRTVDAGHFGLLPAWRREVRFGTHTYNARSETVATLPSYKDSWRRGLRCVVPAKAVYEPRYADDGSSERWRIEREDGTPFGIAGIYTEWLENGEEKFSYSMLTVNCDGHPFYARFHAPGEEKRMPVFLDPRDYDGWMSCPLREAARYFRAWEGPFTARPEPRVRGMKKVAVAKEAPVTGVKVAEKEKPKPAAAQPLEGPPVQGSLF